MLWLGGPNLNVAAGDSPSSRAHTMFESPPGQSRFKRGLSLQVHPESAGLHLRARPVLTLCLMLAAAMLPIRCLLASVQTLCMHVL